MDYNEENGVNLLLPYNKYTLRDFEKDLRGLAMPKITKESVLNSLTGEDRKQLLTHFSLIYNCRALGERELNMVYLAWSYHHHFVRLTGTDEIGDYVDQLHVEFNENDYDLTVEEVEGYPYKDKNLYRFYEMDHLPALLGWKNKPPYDYFWQYHKF